MLFWTLFLEAGSGKKPEVHFTRPHIDSQPIVSHLNPSKAARELSRGQRPCPYNPTLTVMVFVTVMAFDVPVAATVPVMVTV